MSLSLNYPGGRLKTVIIASTAGNVITNKTPGLGKRWIILYGRIRLANDATVVDRFVFMSLTDGTNILTLTPASTAITASQTKAISYNTSVEGINEQASDGVHLAIGKGYIIEGIDQMRFEASNGVVGDSYSGYMRVLELGITP